MKNIKGYSELGALLTETLSENTHRDGPRIRNRLDLSKKSGIDYGYVHRIFAGKHHPSREYLIKICKTLGCTSEQMTKIFTMAQYTTPTSDELEEQPVAA